MTIETQQRVQAIEKSFGPPARPRDPYEKNAALQELRSIRETLANIRSDAALRPSSGIFTVALGVFFGNALFVVGVLYLVLVYLPARQGAEALAMERERAAARSAEVDRFIAEQEALLNQLQSAEK